MRKRKQITWENHREASKAEGKWLIVEAAWEGASALLLIFASISMLSCLSGRVSLQVADGWKLLWIIGLFSILRGAGALAISRVTETKLKKMLRILGSLLPAAGIALIFFRHASSHLEELRGGANAFAQCFFDTYNIAYGTKISMSGMSFEAISAFLCFLMLALFFLLYYLSVLLRRNWPFLLFPLLSASALMYVGLAPRWGQIAAGVTGSFMILQGIRKKEGMIDAMVTAAALLLLCGISGIILGGRAERLLEHSPQAKKYEKVLEENLRTVFSGSSAAADKKVSNGSPRYKDAKIAMVTMDQQPEGNLYFRNFYGTEYQEGTWTAPTEDFLRRCEANGISVEEAAQILSQGISRNGSYENANFEVKYQGSFGQSMLLPYGTDMTSVEYAEIKGDFLVHKAISKTNVSFSAKRTNSFIWDSQQSGFHYVQSSHQDSDRKFWEWYNQFVREEYLSFPDSFYELSAYSILGNSLYENDYHLLSDKTLQEIIIVITVQNYLRTNYRYSWKLDQMERGEDPVEYFLEKGGKGYCVHFAAAGTLLLRSLGVPARYASGYILKPSEFRAQEDGSYAAQIIDRNGHAWVEVYLEDMGWIPVEMTPGYGSDISMLPTSREAEEVRREEEEQEVAESAQASEENNASESEEENPPESEAEPKEASNSQEAAKEPGQETEEKSWEPRFGTGEDGAEGQPGVKPNVLKGLALLLLGIAILAGIFFGIYRYRKTYANRLNRLLKSRYYKAAVVLMNRRVYGRLRRMGRMKKTRATDGDYEIALTEILGDGSGASAAEYLRIVKKAAFSRDEISKEECQAVWHTYQSLGEKK